MPGLLIWNLYKFIAILQIFNLDSFLNISLQPSGFSQNTVGQWQDVICSISLPPGVDPDNTKLGWLNEDEIFTDDNRVTIDTSSDYFNGSTLVTIIQFDPLTEEDEGEYTCYAIINGSFMFESIDLQNFTSKQCKLHACVSLSTLILNSRDWQGNVWLPEKHTYNKQHYKNQNAKKLPQG